MSNEVEIGAADRLTWLAEKIVRWGWWIIALLGGLVLAMESLEIRYFPQSPLHLYELILFFILMGVMGTLHYLLVREVRARTYKAKLDGLSHNLILELAGHDSLEDVTTILVHFPGRIAPVESASLWIYDQVLDQFECLAQIGSHREYQPDPRYQNNSACQFCVQNRPNMLHPLNACRLLDPGETGNGEGLCLPLSIGSIVVGLLIFYLPENQELAASQIDIFNNIGSEMAIALEAAIQRQALTESSIRDAALAERRILSQDLHDHLAQNLSYLRFKLDQFTRAGRQPKIEDILPDLELMHGIAFESSEIVRGRLSQLMPGQAFHLSQLIQDRVRQIAMRSKIEISIDEQGLPLALSRHDLRHIYYIAYEALSNVEKHAQASQALVELSWGEDGLTLEITDDGRGFDPGSVEPREHFGLVIMRQRVEALQGRIEFSTPPQGGTRITAWLPISDPNSQMIESDPQLIDTDA